jgi:hypothetical protein
MNKPVLHTIDPQQIANTVPADPFSPENLRLNQSFTETVEVKKQLATVPVRKP